jgi:hypothetical protein
MPIVDDLSGNNVDNDQHIATGDTGSGSTNIQGPYAAFGTVASNPIVVGGLYNVTPTLRTEGQYSPFQLTARGSLKVALYDASNTPVALSASNGDAVSPLTIGISAQSFNFSFDGTNFVRNRTVLVAPTGTQAVDNPLIVTSDLTALRINVSASGDTSLVAAVAAQTTRVHALRLSVAGAVIVQIKDGATVLEVFNFGAAGGSIVIPFRSRPHYKTTANTALNINLSAAVQVDGRIEYVTTA